MTVIGIFGPPGDQEVEALARRLRHRGAEPWVVDLGAFPGRVKVRWDHHGPLVDGRPLLEMDAAYMRRVGTGLPDHAVYDEPAPSGSATRWRGLYRCTVEAMTAARQNHAVRTGVIRHLARRRAVINPPDLQNLHRLKTRMLTLLRRAGLPVPSFAAGSAPGPMEGIALDLTRRWSGAVDKPLAGVYKTHPWSVEGHAAHPWGRRPALYQRLICGDTVRCYLVEARLLSAARVVHGDTVDSSISQTGTEVLQLPPRGVEVAEAAARTLGLDFCGQDLLLEHRTGEVFLIDCNLAPMFVNYSRATRCDVAGHLADLLIRRAASHADHPRVPVLEMVDQAKDLLAGDPDIARLLDSKRKERG